MKTASATDIRVKLDRYIEQSAQEPIVILNRGKPLAALVSVDDEDDLERLALFYSWRMRAVLDAAKKRISKGRGVDHAEFWRQIEAPRPRRKRRKVRPSPSRG